MKHIMKNFIPIKFILRLMTYGVIVIIHNRDYSAGNDHAKSAKQSDGGKQGCTFFVRFAMPDAVCNGTYF